MARDIPYHDLFANGFEKAVNSDDSRFKMIVFNTSWSGSGQMLDEIIQDVSKDYDHTFDFYRIDADANPQLISNMGIQSFPTILFFQYGVVIDALPGLISEERLRKQLHKLEQGPDEK